MPEFIFNIPASSPASTDSVADGVTDHAAEMLNRLPEQFRRIGDDPNTIETLLQAIAITVQDLSDVCGHVLAERSIETAIGKQLDDIGKIVKEPRNGLDDDTYRRRVRARISVHRSKGTNEDVIKVTDLVIFDDDAVIRVEPQPVATVVVHVENVAVSNDLADDVLFDFLGSTVGAGIRVILESGTAPPEEWFRFDGAGPGFDDGSFIDSRG